MIKSFRDKETEKIYNRERSRAYPYDIQRIALKKLWMIDAATDIYTLKVPPGNRLEALKGDRMGTFSIRINDRWRICFKWSDNNAYDVEIVDYHQELVTMNKKIPPVHPGEILKEEFLDPLEISQYRLAKDINVPPRRINEIVHGTRAITADTALRLGRFFGITPQFWINLQAHYDLEMEKDRIGNLLEKDVKIYSESMG